MKIVGMQKLTLLDYPGKVACTVFLGGCNFRCPWCHNYDLAIGEAPESMTKAYLLEFLEKRKNQLEGVAITGGEPCLNDDLPELLANIKRLGYPVKLDTNGSCYTMLKFVIDNGLVNYVAMDIKNSAYKYKMTTGVRLAEDMKNRQEIRKSIELLMKSKIPYEFRTTVVDELHEPQDFEVIGHMIQGAKNYYLQSFADRDTVPFGNFHKPSNEKMQECLEIVRKYVPQASIRG